MVKVFVKNTCNCKYNFCRLLFSKNVLSMWRIILPKYNPIKPLLRKIQGLTHNFPTNTLPGISCGGRHKQPAYEKWLRVSFFDKFITTAHITKLLYFYFKFPFFPERFYKVEESITYSSAMKAQSARAMLQKLTSQY